MDNEPNVKELSRLDAADIAFIYQAAGLGLELIASPTLNNPTGNPQTTLNRLQQIFRDIQTVVVEEDEKEKEEPREKSPALSGCTSCVTCIQCRSDPLKYHDCIVKYCG